MIRIIAIVAFFLLAPSAHAQTPLTWSVWDNTRTSTMTITWVNPVTGAFVGWYVNNAKDYPQCRGTPYRLHGQTNGQDITWSVLWVNAFENCNNSTTTWTGKIVGNKINSNFVVRWSGGQRAGKDTFTRR